MPSRSHRCAVQTALSFHRIHDPRTARRIVAHTGLAPPSLVVEAGAGDGALTAALAGRGLRVLAVERDRGHFEALSRRFAGAPLVEPVLADIRAFRLPREPYALVSNVPFSITAELMRWLFSLQHPPSCAWLILERDAALHWAGETGSSIASVLAAVDWQLEVAMAIHRREFAPRPSVDAALLHLRRRPSPLLAGAEHAAFERFVRRGFTGARKSAWRNLNGAVGYEVFRRVARANGFAYDAPPSHLATDDWLALFRASRR